MAVERGRASGAASASSGPAAWAGQVTTTASASSGGRRRGRPARRSTPGAVRALDGRRPGADADVDAGHEASRASTRRAMPPMGVAKIGAVRARPPRRRGAGSRCAPRTERMRLGSPERAAASSWGTTAARLRWSVSPALMPPTSGSTRWSTTSSPSRRRRYGPMATSSPGDRGVGRIGGQVEVGSATRSTPAADTDAGGGQGVEVGRHAQHVAAGQGLAGAVDGRGGAVRSAGETSSPSSPRSWHRSSAHGHPQRGRRRRPRRPGRPANDEVRSLPPSRSGSTTVTSAPALRQPVRRGQAGDAAADDHDVRRAGSRRSRGRRPRPGRRGRPARWGRR